MPVRFPIPVPDRLILFSPHPDDISISMGALAACAAELGIPTTIVLVTDGSEARLPEGFLRQHGWTPHLNPVEQATLRGRIRVAEAAKEAETLGFSPNSIHLLQHQEWFTRHQTPAEFLNEDLSLRDVSHFQPGPVDSVAEAEIAAIVGGGVTTVCAVPDPNDRLLMHRITTDLVRRTRSAARILTYECLSTIAPTGNQIAFPFGEDLMDRKRAAILCHASMRARRQAFGGYINSGTEFYDAIAARRNAELARDVNLMLHSFKSSRCSPVTPGPPKSAFLTEPLTLSVEAFDFCPWLRVEASKTMQHWDSNLTEPYAERFGWQ